MPLLTVITQIYALCLCIRHHYYCHHHHLHHHFVFLTWVDNLFCGFRASFLSPTSERWNWQGDSCLPVCLPVLYSLLLPPPSVITSSTAHRLTIRWGQGHKHSTTSSHQRGILNSPTTATPHPVWELQANRRLSAHQRCHSSRANQPVGIRNAKFCFVSLEG